jgi:hypothetical protein
LCKEEADIHDFVLEIGQFGTEQEKGPFLKFVESESADNGGKPPFLKTEVFFFCGIIFSLLELSSSSSEQSELSGSESDHNVGVIFFF